MTQEKSSYKRKRNDAHDLEQSSHPESMEGSHLTRPLAEEAMRHIDYDMSKTLTEWPRGACGRILMYHHRHARRHL